MSCSSRASQWCEILREHNSHERTRAVNYRPLGRTGWRVSAIGFGAWAIGGTWGPVRDDDSLRALHKALDLGVNFFDTADVYGDGRSERLLARLRIESREDFHIATKAGRRLDPHTAAGYTKSNLTAFVEQSLKNLRTDSLDLIQLHCPPTDVYYAPEVFEALENLAGAGKIRYYGVSVERVEEGLKALDYPGVQSIQIIFNIFRQRPADLLFREAEKRKVGLLARLPLSSGLLTGKFSSSSSFAPDDHRAFNRHGEQFDRGETFSGLPFETGLRLVESLRSLVPDGASLTQMALRWILMFPAISCAIPGAKRSEQVEENTGASDLPPLPDHVMSRIREMYDREVRPLVHYSW
jgi:aryl-alcohol dehydrogenase-like predicted oxidoreductase